MYGFLYTNMDAMILVWIIELLDFYMELFDEEETINLLFFFFYEFGSKRILLGILVVFWTWVG